MVITLLDDLMLFHSNIFIFAFLPLTLLGFYFLHRIYSGAVPIVWLVATSLIFYGWWNPRYLPLILLSIAVNMLVAYWLHRTRSRALLVLGIALNLATLGYFKYAWFITSNVLPTDWADPSLAAITLPLGISFYTFQQIAYLVDVYRGDAMEHRLSNYALFVCFFPQLIAGPIVHHKELLPQFRRADIASLRWERFAIGLTIFAIGLFKKVVLADGFAPFAAAIFEAAEAGVELQFFDAWMGATAYGLQLYFDFSGYSDMAVGIAYLFGIRLPINFLSPYKAAGFVEFWRRWHRTLSRFLRDYVYIPLGGNRRGIFRRHTNLMLTMLIGGLWHGAGWTFVVWGALHGAYLVLEHVWRRQREALGVRRRIPRLFAVLLTFAATMFAWVPFRAPDLIVTWAIWQPMMGIGGISLPTWLEPQLSILKSIGFRFDGLSRAPVVPAEILAWCSIGCLIVFLLPNVYEMLKWQRSEPGALGLPRTRWQPILRSAVFVGILLFVALSRPHATTDFLYYQF